MSKTSEEKDNINIENVATTFHSHPEIIELLTTISQRTNLSKTYLINRALVRYFGLDLKDQFLNEKYGIEYGKAFFTLQIGKEKGKK